MKEASPDCRAARTALERLRAALRAKNWRQVEALSGAPASEHHTRGDHPLLARAEPEQRAHFLRAVASGATRARREELARAWSLVSSEVVAVHPLSGQQAEIIERVWSDSERPFELSTRMDASSGAWVALESNRVLEDRLMVWIPRPVPHGDARLSPEAFTADYAAQRRGCATLELRSSSELSVASPTAQMRGRILAPVAVLREYYPSLARHKSVICLTADLPEQLDARLRCIGTLGPMISTLLRQLAHGVLVPEQARFLDVASFSGLVEAAGRDVMALARLWVSISTHGSRVRTAGMRYFRLPELETSVEGCAAHAEAFLGQMIDDLLERRPPLRVGMTLGDRRAPTHRVLPGSLGPAPGWSYGRAGSLFLSPLAATTEQSAV